jgi:hypothetical protein
VATLDRPDTDPARDEERRFSPASLVFGLAFAALAVATLANSGRIPAGGWLLPCSVIVVGVALLLTASWRNR